MRRRRDCRVGVDGRGDGAADGVAGGRAWGSRTLSLQQRKIILVHSVHRLGFHRLWASKVQDWDAK